MGIDKEKAERIYRKSIEVLKQVQLPNGGCFATPVGERYPYVYPRDHSIITLGFLSAGLYERAKKALNFILKCDSCAKSSGAFPQRLDRHGRDASYKPVQIDGTALVIYSLAKYVDLTHDTDIVTENWERIKKAAAYIIRHIDKEKGLVYTPNSIHEFPPTEEGLEIWANCACYAALRSIGEMSKKLKINHYRMFMRNAKKIRKGILKYLWNNREKIFIKNIRVRESSSVLLDSDASEYGIAEFGVLKDSDKRVISTVKRIEKDLWHKKLGGICRYPKYRGRNNGGWGPWPHFTLMICKHFIKLKDRKNADRYLQWVLDISYNDLLPEHIAEVKEFEEFVSDFKEAGILRPDRLVMIRNARRNPMFKKGIAYITTPLAWPHAEFIRTWNLYKEVFMQN